MLKRLVSKPRASLTLPIGVGLALAVLAFPVVCAQSGSNDTAIPTAPLGKTIRENRKTVAPGITHIHRQTDDPINIHILLVDLSHPHVEVRTVLSHGTVAGVETVRDMVKRTGAIAGVNGDYWGPHGVEQGLTIVDGEIVIAPKHRTALGITRDRKAEIGIWSDSWAWNSLVRSPSGNEHPITMMNSDFGENWLVFYTDKYGLATPGDKFPNVTEMVLNGEGEVSEIRFDQPGIDIPKGYKVLSGRGSSSDWLRANLKIADKPVIDLKSSRSWENLQHAISAGPRILRGGEFFQDPISIFPEGEEFDLSWKRSHYQLRQPRTAAGVSKDGKKLILITVDGRMPQFSLGIYQREMAGLLKEYGAWDGLDLDSGGSTTMVIRGELVNRPSDRAKPDGSGGVERPVANGLLIYHRSYK